MPHVVAVDLGNSVAKIALVRDGSIMDRAEIITADIRDIHRSSALRDSVDGIGRLLVDRPPVILGSVVSWAGARLAALLTGAGCRVRPVTSLDFTALGTAIDYQYGEPGVDRVAASVEAFLRTGGPVVVVGLGTAVHTNVVTGEGVYRGGAIMPGLRLMSESLGIGTDQVGVISPKRPERVIGASTPECVEIGIYHGWLGGTLRLIRETVQVVDGASVWLSGGHAEWIAPELPEAHVDADLSVLGLARLAEHVL